MNKLLVALLGLSLAANALLVWQRAVTLEGNRKVVRPPHESASLEEPSAAGKLRPEALQLLTRLATSDLPALRDALRSAGWPPDLIRAVLKARLQEKYGMASPVTRSAWWRNNSRGPEARRRAEQDQAWQNRIQQETAALLGEPASASLEPDDIHGFLPANKLTGVRQIEKDYGELSKKVGWGGVADWQAQEKLEAEKFRELGEILTPEELQEYRLRFSRTAESVRELMAGFEPTEAEFRVAFAIQTDYEERFGFLRFKGTPEDFEKGQQDMQAAVLRNLGPEHGMDYLWGNDGEYQGLKEAVQAGTLGRDVPGKVMQLRADVGKEASAYQNNASLSYDQKMAALQALADKAQARLAALVPPEIAAQSNHTLFHWVTALRSGQIYVFNAMNHGTGVSQVSPPVPPKG